MISFNLICSAGHGFEGWFKSSEDFDNQQSRGLLTCPICDDHHISKALMAPNVAAKSNTKNDGLVERSIMPTTPVPTPSGQEVSPPPMATKQGLQITPELAEAAAEALAEMRKVQNKIIETCDDVGDGFAEEARKIHYGEAESRGIYGSATDDEAEALHEEGIEIAKMPWLPKEQ